MPDSDYLLTLVREALNELDSESGRVSVATRKAARIARLRGDWRALYRLQLELVSFDDRRARQQVMREVAPYFSREEFRRFHEQALDESMSSRSVKILDLKSRRVSDDKVTTLSVAELEDGIAAYTRLGTSSYPPNLHPVDAYFMAKENEAAEVASSVAAGELKRVVRRVGERVYAYLGQVEAELHNGRTEPDIIEQNRQYVDRRLREVSPQAAEALIASYRRVRDGDTEARSHALTSCRRALKLLADSLYPPRDKPATGSDGKLHPVTEDKYLNRLRQFLTESAVNATSRELLASSLDEIGTRLDRLNDLSSKGVHADVSEFEVSVCITQTYSTTTALLLLLDGQSAAIGDALT